MAKARHNVASMNVGGVYEHVPTSATSEAALRLMGGRWVRCNIVVAYYRAVAGKSRAEATPHSPSY
jgi:hypothetical protein